MTVGDLGREFGISLGITLRDSAEVGSCTLGSGAVDSVD